MGDREFEEVEVVPLTIQYTIRKWDGGDGFKAQYDWVNESGEESDEFFDSADEARKDFL